MTVYFQNPSKKNWQALHLKFQIKVEAYGLCSWKFAFVWNGHSAFAIKNALIWLSAHFRGCNPQVLGFAY